MVSHYGSQELLYIHLYGVHMHNRKEETIHFGEAPYVWEADRSNAAMATVRTVVV